MSGSNPAKTATMADLLKIVEQASKSETAWAELKTQPETALARHGLAPTAQAVTFLRAVGSVPYTPGVAPTGPQDPDKGKGEG